MPGSRISVEVVGSSSELQAAVAKAADSLKGLGSVLARQTDLAMAAGEKTVRMNEAVSRSYRAAATSATTSSREAAVSYSRASVEQTAASERVTRAVETQARAAKLSAEQQVRANDLAAASAARLAARQEASAAKTRAAFGTQNSELTRMGRTLSAGLLGAAVASTYLAVKFQANTTRLQTQAGATAKQVDQLRKGMLDMASQVGFVPNQLADGMYHVVSSMNAVLPRATRVKEELQILKVAAEGAAIGHSNLEETTYALASAMNALHQRGSDAQKTMGELNAIVGSGDMTMNDLLEALKSGLIPAANTFHISLQSVGAALAVMGDMGMRGALAGTRLRMSIALLGAPSQAAAKYLTAIGMSSQEATARTDEMQQVLKKAGLTTTTLADDLKKPNGLAVALQDLNAHLVKSGLSANAAAALISHAFGGGRSGAAIQLLAQNTDRLNLKFKQIGDGASGFGRSWATTQQTLAFQLKQTEATAVALATRLGTDLLPVVHDLLGDLKDMVHWFEQNHAAVVALEIVLGTFAAVTIGSFFVSQIRKAIMLAKELKSALTFGSIAGPKVLPGGGVGGVGGVGGAAALTGLRGAASGLFTVASTAAIAVAAGLALKQILNKPISAPGGSGPVDVAKRLNAGGAGFATVDLLKQLQGKGAFSAKAADDAGRSYGAAFVHGFQSVKFPTQGLLIEDMMNRLKQLPARARPEAAKVMLQYAEGLAQQGKLPRKAVDSMIASIEQAFPGLRSYLMQEGAANDRQLAVSLKFNAATSQLKQTLANYRQQFGDWAINTKITGQNIDANVGLAMTHLKEIVRSSTGDTRRQAVSELEHMRTQVNATFTQMGTQVALKTGAMKDSIVHGSAQAAIAAITNFSKFEQAVQSAMAGGALTASEGMIAIAKATDQVIASLGGQKIPIPALIHAQDITAKFSAGKTGVAGVLTAAAAGGFIGTPGEKGKDQVPIVVGRGEAVLNHSQQRVVNAALAAQGIGGLPEVFSKVTTPHYMARGGYASGGQVNAATNPGAYVSPFPSGTSITWERQDAGKDMVVAPGTPVLAIGDGSITGIAPNWFAGQPLIEQSLINGPDAGKFVYYAEGLTSRVSAGQGVKAGQVIGVTTSQPTGLEFGWGGGGTSTLRSQVAGGGDSAGWWSSTYEQFIRALVGGHSIAVSGNFPAGAAAPTWKDIAVPGVSGKGAIADTVRAALKKTTDAANAYGRKQVGALGGTGGSAVSVGGPVQKQIAAALASVGFNKVAIAGIMGNISQESSYNPNDPGGGLFQFTPRIPGDNGSVAEQINLMMSHGGSGIVGAMNAQGSPAAAAAYFMNNFERPGIPALGNRIAGANAAFAAGYAPGGFVADARHRSARPPAGSHATHTSHTSKPSHAKAKQTFKGLGPKDLQGLTQAGNRLGHIEQDIASRLAQYSALTSRFGALEQSPQFINADGSTNPAGIAQTRADDLTLLGIAQAILGDYNTELPLVSSTLSKFLGSQSKTNRTLTTNQKRQASNHVREASIREAILALSKPTADQVGAIESQLKHTRLQFDPQVKHAEQALTQYRGTTATGEKRYREAIHAAEHRRATYHGTDKATRRRLSDAVSNATLAYHAYLNSEEPTKARLSQAIQDAKGAESNAIGPLDEALLTARDKRRNHKLKVNREQFHLRQQLASLVKQDAVLHSTDLSLAGVLTGSGGQEGENKIIGTLETIAQKLGTVTWTDSGRFAGINTSNQGAAFDEQTTIDQLQNTLSQLGANAGSATTADQSLLLSLTQQENLQLASALALNQSQTRALASMIPEIPRYKDGGPVMRDGLIYAHGGEYVVPAGGAAVGGGGPTTVEVHQHFHGSAGEIMRMIDQRVQHDGNVRVISKKIGQRTSMLSGAPGGGR